MQRLPDLAGVRRRARARARHDRRPHPLPPPPREARAARLRSAHPDEVRRLHRARLRVAARRHRAPRVRAGRGRRASRTCSCACTPNVSPATCSVRCAATAARSSTSRWNGSRADGRRCRRLPARPRRARHRARAQAARVLAAGPRPRHRRGEPRARLPARLARVRHRFADPRRPRRHHDAADDEQPGEVRRHRGLRPRDRRPRPAAHRADRREHRVPPAPSSASSATCSTSTTTKQLGRGAERDDGRVLRAHEGELDATGMRFAIAVARFNHDITEALARRRASARSRSTTPATSTSCGCRARSSCRSSRKRLAASGAVDAVICIGAVVRGDTPHFEYVAGECAAGHHARRRSTPASR